MSDLFGNPEDRFLHGVGHISLALWGLLHCLQIVDFLNVLYTKFDDTVSIWDVYRVKMRLLGEIESCHKEIFLGMSGKV